MSTRASISVVVCTHNRAAFLRPALDSLAGQTLDKARYEVIVVDNGSTDETATVVRAFLANEHESTIRVIDEPVLGLGYARNTGWKAAVGEYVAFMDDDARADARWLERALSLFEKSRPAPIAVGGQIRPWYMSPKPAWYKDEYEVRSWGRELRRLSAGESFSGSNMIFSQHVLREFGGFDVNVGMRGARVSMGEETVLFRRISDTLGDRAILLYDPDLIVYHAVSRRKMTVRYHLSRWFVAGQVACRLDAPSSFRERLSRFRAGVTTIRSLMGSALEQRRLFPHLRSWMVERLGPVALETGRLLAGMGLHLSVRRPELKADLQPGGVREGTRWCTR
jgi:glycosyltransferase involved in cell wall biosynthesis